MAHVSYPLKKPNKSVFQKPSSFVTQDSIYWKKLGQPVLVKEFGAIDYLDFSPIEPYYFAATCSVRVQIYDPVSKVVAKNISKFKETAYGGCFRGDGKLLVAGSEDGVVKLFDVQSKNVLRVFTGHTAPVHRTFFTKDQTKIISFSDDKSVSLWDIATEEKLTTFTEHNDYVRTGAPSPISPEIILSGGYDHSVKLYDCRSNETIMNVSHGSPVESTLFLPSGGLFISAGGTEIKVWDIFNGGKLLANVSQHHKTVTTLRLASNSSRLMSASLDRHVKIYDISTFKVVHNLDFPNAVLSMAVSEHDDILAVGMVDGVISIRKREQIARHSDDKKGLFKFAPDHIPKPSAQITPTPGNTTVDAVVSKLKQEEESNSDKFIRKLQYNKALAEVIKTVVAMKYPEKTAAVIQELLRRGVLNEAIARLNEKEIANLLKFFNRYLGETRFTHQVIDAANVFIDIYENQIKSFSDENLKLYKLLRKRINEEVEVCKSICELEGAIGLLLSGAQVTSNRTNLEISEMFTPSSKAQKEIVIDV